MSNSSAATKKKKKKSVTDKLRSTKIQKCKQVTLYSELQLGQSSGSAVKCSSWVSLSLFFIIIIIIFWLYPPKTHEDVSEYGCLVHEEQNEQKKEKENSLTEPSGNVNLPLAKNREMKRRTET